MTKKLVGKEVEKERKIRQWVKNARGGKLERSGVRSNGRNGTKKLVERVVYEGNWEANYILKLHEYFYKEGKGRNTTRYEVLCGGVEE